MAEMQGSGAVVAGAEGIPVMAENERSAFCVGGNSEVQIWRTGVLGEAREKVFATNFCGGRSDTSVASVESESSEISRLLVYDYFVLVDIFMRQAKFSRTLLYLYCIYTSTPMLW